MRVRLFASTLCALLALWVPPLQALAQDCPPVAAPPTPEQLQQGQAKARDRGALWKLKKDGRTSYLYGTAHVGQLDWIFPGPNLRQALRETEVLAVEVDVTAPDTQREMAEAQRSAAPLPLSAEEQQRLDTQAKAACVPTQALAHLHPVMQAVTYVALSGRRAGLDPAFGQEMALLGAARSLQRPIVALETIGLQMSVLLPKEESKARRMLHMTLEGLEKGESPRTLERLGKAWVEGDLALLGDIETLCQCKPSEEERAFHKMLNDDRNPHLARRIAEEHGKGKPVLAAVGLLHMSGPQALPGLLKAQGFEVERLH